MAALVRRLLKRKRVQFLLKSCRGLWMNVLSDSLDRLVWGKVLPRIGHPVSVDPRALVGEVRDARSIRCRAERRGISRVRSGDWDKNPKPIRNGSERHYVQLLLEYFESGRSDADKAALLEQYKAIAGHAPTKVVTKCDELYASVSSHGFRSDIGDPRLRWLPFALRRWFPDGVSGIQIAIARDGSLLKAGGGNHRLALALHLEMTEVPALVCIAHRDWVLAEITARRNRQI